jgi:hypothetical protein
MQFELRAKHALGMNGHTIPAGGLVATMQTEHLVLVDNLASGLYFGDIVAVQKSEPIEDAAAIKQVRRDRRSKKSTEATNERAGTDPVEGSDLDPDALNAQADDDDDDISDQPAGVKDSLTLQSDSDNDADLGTDVEISYPGLEGLSPRIAKALGDAGLVDREKVADHYKTNGVFDLEGIGRAAERKIVAWIEG